MAKKIFALIVATVLTIWVVTKALDDAWETGIPDPPRMSATQK